MQSPVLPRQPLTALRIAVVTETYPPEINGVARTVGLMVDELLARGHHIQLVRPRQAGESADAPASRTSGLEERLTIGFRIPNYPELQIGIIRRGLLLRDWSVRRPDIVHVVTEGPLGWSALLAARKLGIPVVSDFHTNFHDYSRHYGLGWISGLVAGYLRALHNRADCTFVPTHEMRDRLRALRFNALSIVGRGIDTRLFNPARRSAELRRSWQCRDDTPVALYVGRLAAEKNLRLFVQSIRAAQYHRPDLCVVIVGDGPMGKSLRAENPDFLFAGMRTGEDLAAVLRVRRSVRVSEPERDLRQCDDGGAGKRAGGGRIRLCRGTRAYRSWPQRSGGLVRRRERIPQTYVAPRQFRATKCRSCASGPGKPPNV